MSAGKQKILSCRNTPAIDSHHNLRMMKRALMLLYCVALALLSCTTVHPPEWLGDAVNSANDDIAACRNGDALLILRLEADGTESLWQTFLRADGTWSKTEPAELPPARHVRAGKPTVAQVGDGQLLVVFPAYRTPHNVDLAESFFNGSTWSPPRWLDELNSTQWDSQPALSSDGGILVFVSDRRGNKDLYVSRRTSKGWSEPEHLLLNTIGDEITPAVLPDSTLLFARRRDTTGGDFQLYRALQATPFHWHNPEALPEPINSSADDIAPVAWDSMVIISSNRAGNFDLYLVRLCGPVQLHVRVHPSPVISQLDGILTIASARTIETVSVGASGSCIVSLEPCQHYLVRYLNQCSGSSYQRHLTAPCDPENAVVLDLPIVLAGDSTSWERTFTGIFAPDDYLPATEDHRVARSLLAQWTGALTPIAGQRYHFDTLYLAEIADRIASIFRCAPTAFLQITIAAPPTQQPVRYYGAPLTIVIDGSKQTQIFPGDVVAPSTIALLRAYALQHLASQIVSQKIGSAIALNQIRWHYTQDDRLPYDSAKIRVAILE